MKTILDLLGAAASGGFLGVLGSLATTWFRLKEKREDNAHQIALAEVAGRNAEAAASWQAFAASQTASASDMNEKVSPWAANWRAVTRPGLTLILVVASVGLTAFAPAEVKREAIIAVHSLTGTAVAWWFGSRMATASASGKTARP